MENIKHLIEVLKSQVLLYAELMELMTLEKECIVSWNFKETLDINKKKEELLRKERIQDEARRSLLAKISIVSGITDMSLSKTINWTSDESDKEALLALGDELLHLVSKIHEENLSLRIMYSTNNRMVNDFFDQLGTSDTSGYSANNRRISTYHKMA